MGTRGLLGFIIKGVKKGTYNHWDSYPTGLGLAIMRWIQTLTEEDIAKMTEQVEKIEWYLSCYRIYAMNAEVIQG